MQSNIYKLPFADLGTYEQIEKLRDVKRQIKALEDEEKELSNNLKAGYFLNHDDFLHNGRLIATYRPIISIILDQKKLESEKPDLYKEYQKILSYRKLSLK